MRTGLISLHDGLRGLRSNLKFSNRFQLIYDRFFRRKLKLTHYIWKNRFVVICNSRAGDHISIQECLCERAYDSLLDKCNFPSNHISYVNVGANIGAFDLLLVDRGLIVDNGLAVELNPHTATRCMMNLHVNDLDSTRVINAGIAENNGTVRFSPRDLSITDSIYEQPRKGVTILMVESMTLETLLSKHGNHFQQFDLLKLDCEQAEYAIIRTTPASLLKKFRYIIVEFHTEPEGETINAAYSKLKEAGFLSQHPPPVGKLHYTDVFIRC